MSDSAKPANEMNELPKGPTTEFLVGFIGNLLTDEHSEILPSTRWYDDLDLDSLDMVEAVVAAERLTGATIAEEYLHFVDTVGELWVVIDHWSANTSAPL